MAGPELQGSFGDQLAKLHSRLEKGTPKEAIVNKKLGRPERPYIVPVVSLRQACMNRFEAFGMGVVTHNNVEGSP